MQWKHMGLDVTDEHLRASESGEGCAYSLLCEAG